MKTQKNRGGRPPKSSEDRQEAYLDVRLKRSEKKAFQDAANFAGLPLAGWVRERLRQAAIPGAQLYLEDPADGISGAGAFSLLLDEPEVYGLPPDPVVTTRDLPRMWRHVATAAGAMLAGGLVTALGRNLWP